MFTGPERQYRTALHTFLTRYFDGKEHEVTGIATELPKVKIFFAPEILPNAQPNSKPPSPQEVYSGKEHPVHDLIITQIGSSHSNEKCNHRKDDVILPGFECRTNVRLSLAMRTLPVQGSLEMASMLCGAAWDAMASLIESKRAALSDIGIYKAEIQRIATEANTPQMAIRLGLLRIETRSTYIQDAYV